MSFSWAGRLTVAKISLLPKLIYTFSTIAIVIPARCFFVDIGNIILNLYGKTKEFE